MTELIAGPCIAVKDRACAGACPVGCIYRGERMLCILRGTGHNLVFLGGPSPPLTGAPLE